MPKGFTVLFFQFNAHMGTFKFISVIHLSNTNMLFDLHGFRYSREKNFYQSKTLYDMVRCYARNYFLYLVFGLINLVSQDLVYFQGHSISC